MASKLDIRFGIITDLHLGWDDQSLHNVQAAMADFGGLDLDLLVILGDMADMREEYWSLVQEHIIDQLTLPTIFVRGNADFQAGGEAPWAEVVKQPVRHALNVGGAHIVAVGAQSEQHLLPIGDDAMGYIEAEMAAHADEFGIVLCHPPLRNTTYWSCDNDDDHCLAELLPAQTPPYKLQLKESAAMAETLRRTPSIRLFLSGHVHNDHRMRCDHGYGPIEERDGVIHIATANLGGWVGVGVPRREGRVIEVNSEEIIVRVRDVIDSRYVDELERRFPTLRPSA